MGANLVSCWVLCNFLQTDFCIAKIKMILDSRFSILDNAIPHAQIFLIFIEHRVSIIQYPVSSIEHRVSSIQYRVSSIQQPETSIEHPAK